MLVFSKLLSAITQLLFWLALWWVVALLLLSRWRRAAVCMLWLGLGVYPSSTANPDFSRFRLSGLNKIKHLQLMF